MIWLIVILVMAYIGFAIYAEYRKGKTIIFKEGAWLKLKRVTTGNSYPQYIRLNHKITEASDFSCDYSYFEPDGKIKESRNLMVWQVKVFYEYDMSIAHALEISFINTIEKREASELKERLDMQKQALKAFLKN